MTMFNDLRHSEILVQIQEAMTSEGIGTNGKLNAEKALPRQPDSGPNSAESEQPTYIQSGKPENPKTHHDTRSMTSIKKD